ncbi:hydantoinase B/oxoprolinase family protein [Brevibacillus fluminis]|uniref:Hydantoinase B/oxoprolinase family protein n=1 Tax=Brevibacillus fluminis TaxID=511487 RepID=A0A3M8CXJ0_9BACL|nr:hydantoinase B/oxoprolinase family protein [Brevibacillus fluminis]RNB80031.1 hydantoinase B/oxoprolinase family protein [Brevibacillus fluminis]
MTRTVTDPFTLEIVKDKLIAISDEMFYALQRTSKSPIIYEVLDYATGLTNAEGDLLTQGNGITGFLGNLTFAVKDTLEKFRDNLHPGDLIMTNTPYSGGGSHLSDVALVMPIFYEGQLVAFSANKAHWTEIGGMAPGSWTPLATEIYQEGLQLPCIKLFDRGVLNQALVDIIEVNVRTPDLSIGDMWAQVSALRTGEKRIKEVCQKYGAQTVLDSMNRLLDQGEAIARAALRKMPNGVYEAEDWIDDDGMGSGPLRVHVKVEITDDEFICDFRGNPPQVQGPINSTYTGLVSAIRTVFVAVTNPAQSINDGAFRPIRVLTDRKTIFTAERPAPVSIYWESNEYVSELIWKALMPIAADKLTAGHFLSVCSLIISGSHPETDELFLLVEPSAGGWGAGMTQDGQSGQFCIGDGETYVIPIEVAEARYGIIVDQFALNTDGGGAGERRGGSGLIRDYRIVGDEVQVSASFGRHQFVPWGANGGHSGTRNAIQLFKDGVWHEPTGKVGGVTLKKGDIARFITGSGGGYGSPLQREPQRVADDVKNGYITREEAERTYGVRVTNDYGYELTAVRLA